MEKQKKQGAYYRKGKTYDEVYGLEKSKLIKNKMSLKGRGKKKEKLSVALKEHWKNPENKESLINRNKKISQSLTGRKLSEKHKEKNRQHMLGKTAWNKGLIGYNKGHKVSQKTIDSIMKTKGRTFEEIFGEEKAKEMKKGIREARAKQIFPTKDSSIEIKIQNFLTQLNIKFLKHQYMEIEHGYQCDILIPSMNLVIEIDGDYWHCNLKIFPNPNEWQLKQIELDKIRTQELIESGFKVLRLWECEINVMNLDNFIVRLNI
jgi:G:T-mismatch repair DNA endonuclease (very short patch repair protein)